MRTAIHLSLVAAASLLAALPMAGALDDSPDLAEGQRLFDEETFGGNGRTCVTCHSVATGTISPEDVRARLRDNRKDSGGGYGTAQGILRDPLFLHDGLDDGVSGTSRIAEHATVRVEIPLPPGITLKDDPAATSVTFLRGVPTTVNTPALDPLLMYDARAPDLQTQAHGAIMGHAQATIEPTVEQLDMIAEFEVTDPRFFSSVALEAYAMGGPEPVLPDGTTDSEKRGRAMFDDVPFNPITKAGACSMCHSGPMLNTVNAFNPNAPMGAREFNISVSSRNLMGNPVYTFLVEELDGSIVEVVSPDPGLLLTYPPPLAPLPRAFPTDFFKIPQLWGVKDFAPHFHDNSAKTLEDVAEHYDFFFQELFGVELSAQDQADMVAFMKLL